uniref:photosystem I reaction center subunit II(ferredoxin-binding) n=1 Tax=Lophurella stichidiosa TaxID=2008659 RepID=UPI002551CF69|nr:photosystem I reaction center subunit II(ferredoxin-binding) [Aphanocladia stichidiosa]WGH14005.1 photosystem I reaction center subunit II(ferredoxin-binding) [Aphanocladia stichidiosa]
MNNTINFKMPSPTFGGSTGGWLRSAEIEEKYAITWNTSKKNIFEMPTGGSAIMAEGDNLLYLAKKEQCLALSSQLKKKFKITNFKIYRIFPNGEVQYLHPKDGVFPENVNEGRIGIGNIKYNIGQNDNPVNKKFTGQATYE